MHCDNNLGDCNVIFIHQKRHFFYRSIFKSFIGRGTRLLIDNSPESRKSYILLGLFRLLSLPKEDGQRRIIYVSREQWRRWRICFFIVTRPDPGAGGCFPHRLPGGMSCTGESSALHLWMSVIWGPRPALYFLNPIWTENVFGLYCMTSPSLSKRSKRGRGWGLAF